MLCDPHSPRSHVPNLGMGLEESAADQPPANGAAPVVQAERGGAPAPEMLAHRAERGGRTLWRRSKVSLADAALAYAELGIPVYPSHWPVVGSTRRLGTPGCSCQLVACSSPGEHPLVPDWLGAATADPARMEAWWCQHPRANIGLLTGVVFDVLDVPSEQDQAVLATLPEGPVARTGTGRHHYFVAPSGRGNVVMPARSGNARQRVYWHGRSGYALAARAATSAAAPPSGCARSAPRARRPTARLRRHGRRLGAARLISPPAGCCPPGP
jgi:hypothetical protein